MYLRDLTIKNFRCFGSDNLALQLNLKKGLTALVGENDGGKSAIVDAIRFALGTADQEYLRVRESDFNDSSKPITVVCCFDDLSESDQASFLEFLTYSTEPSHNSPLLYIHWTVPPLRETVRGWEVFRTETRSGAKGEGPSFPSPVHDMLRATYLRPLRDAQRSLTAGRGSRLAAVLTHFKGVSSQPGLPIPSTLEEGLPAEVLKALGVVSIGDLTNLLLRKQAGIQEARTQIDKHLAELDTKGDAHVSDIRVSGATLSDESRLRSILEKLDLILDGPGDPGLGSSNLLFMACELLLLSQSGPGPKLLLIEEPEAHLHPQRQIRVMDFLQDKISELGIQVLVTTHSPVLASVVKLQNLVLVRKPSAYSLDKGKTRLANGDYRFLERYLDATKANLFFARGVIVVEGPSEALLLPAIAKGLGRDLAAHGVSIVNVGGVGLRRYARILQRPPTTDNEIGIPVACITDLDVMPDCAPIILEKVEEGASPPEKSKRQWRVRSDFDDLPAERQRKKKLVSGTDVRTFVSDEWTLEYDLAVAGLAEEVYISTRLAARDSSISSGGESRSVLTADAREEFKLLEQSLPHHVTCNSKEVLAATIYKSFAVKGVSKPIAAQYLAELLSDTQQKLQDKGQSFRGVLPPYLVAAIEHVTSPLPSHNAPGASADA